MKPCAFVHLSGAAVLVLSTFAGCGGTQSAAQSPDTAQTQAAASAEPAAPEPSASAASPAATPPAGSAASDDDSAPETRTMDVIAGVIKTHRKEARDCYEKALKQIPGLKGDLVVHFTLTPAGKVKSAEVNMQRSTLTNEVTAKCVMDVIRSLPFPESSKGMESNVNYPFNFNP